jgi:hypothetical protein
MSAMQDAFARAEAARREENYARIQATAQAHARLLPRGTNSGKVKVNLGAEAVQKNTGATLRLKPNPVHNERGFPPNYVHARKVKLNLSESQYQRELLKQALAVQTVQGQSQHVERHMNMTKPVLNSYGETIKPRDRALDWERKPDLEPSKIRTLAAIRARNRDLEASGVFDYEDAY